MEPDNEPIEAEKTLAERIETLRLDRGWSYGDLSLHMGNAGCPIERSSLQKIAKGNPPRKITVNELVAFAAVFKTSLEVLLTPEQTPTERVLSQHDKYLEAVHEMRRAAFGVLSSIDDVREYLEEHSWLLDQVEFPVGVHLDSPDEYLAVALESIEGRERGYYAVRSRAEAEFLTTLLSTTVGHVAAYSPSEGRVVVDDSVYIDGTRVKDEWQA